MDKPPASILIVGSGVFGLSIAFELTKRPFFAKTRITLVDHAAGQFTPEDAASSDSSRIIRADYADAAYSELMTEAHKEWRKQGDGECGGNGRYSECGLALTANHAVEGAFTAKKSGMGYARSSWENVSRLAKDAGQLDKIEELPDREALRKVTGGSGNPGDWGYLNKLSGWADATASIKWFYEKVKATGRINFVDGNVEQLMTEDDHVVGAKLEDQSILKADVVFCAAGAWTGALVDVRGRCEATGHVLGYMEITPEEEATLGKQPVVLNLTSGLFVIPPRDGVLKLARHSFGYLNPQLVEHALPLSPLYERRPFLASLPHTSRNDPTNPFPAEADRDLRRAVDDLIPIKGLRDRPWVKTRICWYSDTRDADWLADWHPGWHGLFVAAGDSGHGFKFMPVLGEKLVDCLQGKGGKLGAKWRWKDMEDDGAGRERNGVYNGLITEDGSRGGSPGMVLKEELGKGAKLSVQ